MSKKPTKSTKKVAHRRSLGSPKDFEVYVLDLLRMNKKWETEKIRVSENAKAAVSRIISDWIADAARSIHSSIDAENNTHKRKRTTVLPSDISAFSVFLDSRFNAKFVDELVKEQGATAPAIARSRVESHFRSQFTTRIGHDATVALTVFIQYLGAELLNHVAMFMRSSSASSQLFGAENESARQTINYKILNGALRESPFWAKVCGVSLSSYSGNDTKDMVVNAIVNKKRKGASQAAPSIKRGKSSRRSSRKSSKKSSKKASK